MVDVVHDRLDQTETPSPGLVERQEVRDTIAAKFHEVRPDARALFSLPGKNGQCMIAFKRFFPDGIFLAVEHSIGMAQRMSFHRENEIDLTLYPCSVQRFITGKNLPVLFGSNPKPLPQIDLAWLDYQGFLNQSMLGDVTGFVQKRMTNTRPVGVAITIMPKLGQTSHAMIETLVSYTEKHTGRPTSVRWKYQANHREDGHYRPIFVVLELGILE